MSDISPTSSNQETNVIRSSHNMETSETENTLYHFLTSHYINQIASLLKEPRL